jgi:hypothetical protein
MRVVRLHRFLLATTTLISAACAVFACSDPPRVSRLRATDDPPEDAPPKKRNDAGGSDDLPPGADPPLPDGGKPPGRVFAHTHDKLYLFDPLANTLTEIGPFSCVPHDQSKPDQDLENDSVIDLALDRTGNMYATTFWRFIKVDPTSGACTVIRIDTLPYQYPNSLSFVPMGSEEALVGYAFDQFDDATIYTRIDLATGEMSDMQNLNPTPPLNGVEYGISGDVISLIRTNGKTYAAVKQVTGDAGTGDDLLAEVDPSTGTLTRIIGDTGQKGFYGLGFWAGTAYGFTAAGEIYAVDVDNGSSKLVLTGQDSNGVSLSWYGAGVTTDSPTAP